MPRMDETAIGVDVGGTHIRAARVTADGEIRDHIAQPVERTASEFTGQVHSLIAAMRDETTQAIGIGVPGRVNAQTGDIVSVGYLDITGLNLVDVVFEEVGLPVHIENDATMALVAESRHPDLADHALVFMVTIGTGIGGAILQDGRPWYGGGISGQFGHLIVASEGPVCNCGAVGCVETFSSGTALGALIRATGFPADTQVQKLFDLANDGDAGAVGILTAWAAPMRRALQSLTAVADPNLIIFGGGLGWAMEKALGLEYVDNPWFSVPVTSARLGDSAGVIGAALRALDKEGSAR